jgi:hypothetical protein
MRLGIEISSGGSAVEEMPEESELEIRTYDRALGQVQGLVTPPTSNSQIDIRRLNALPFPNPHNESKTNHTPSSSQPFISETAYSLLQSPALSRLPRE